MYFKLLTVIQLKYSYVAMVLHSNHHLEGISFGVLVGMLSPEWLLWSPLLLWKLPHLGGNTHPVSGL